MVARSDLEIDLAATILSCQVNSVGFVLFILRSGPLVLSLPLAQVAHSEWLSLEAGLDSPSEGPAAGGCTAIGESVCSVGPDPTAGRDSCGRSPWEN